MDNIQYNFLDKLLTYKTYRSLMAQKMINALDIDDLPDNCLVIFDDTDTLKNKDILKNINNLKDQILECGRHKRITALITSHLACKSNETKTLLNESHQIFFYLKSGCNYSRLLEHYLGFDKKQIQKLKKIDSRFICFCRSYPQCFYSKNEIYLMKDF